MAIVDNQRREGVLLVAEEDVHRRGLELLLTAYDLRVVAAVADPDAAQEAARRGTPRLVLIDLALGERVTTLVRGLGQLAPRLPTLGYGDRRSWPLQELLDAGLRGFVLTTSGCDVFVEAVRTVMTGAGYLDPAFAIAPAGVAERPGRSVLSDRERQVVGLLAHGLTGREIAAQLFLSPATVRTHVQNAMHKLGARTRAQAIAIVSGDGSGHMAA